MYPIVVRNPDNLEASLMILTKNLKNLKCSSKLQARAACQKHEGALKYTRLVLLNLEHCKVSENELFSHSF
jgi:hypothetical protein